MRLDQPGQPSGQGARDGHRHRAAAGEGGERRGKSSGAQGPGAQRVGDLPHAGQGLRGIADHVVEQVVGRGGCGAQLLPGEAQAEQGAHQALLDGVLKGPGVLALPFHLPVREERERPVAPRAVPGAGRIGEGQEDVQGRVAAARPGQRHQGPLDPEKGAVDPGERAPAAHGAGPPGGLRLPGAGGRVAVRARRPSAGVRPAGRAAVAGEQVGRTAVGAQLLGRTCAGGLLVGRTAVCAQQVGRTAVSHHRGGRGVRVAHRVIGAHGPDRLPYDVKEASQLVGDRPHRARSFPQGSAPRPRGVAERRREGGRRASPREADPAHLTAPAPLASTLTDTPGRRIRHLTWKPLRVRCAVPIRRVPPAGGPYCGGRHNAVQGRTVRRSARPVSRLPPGVPPQASRPLAAGVMPATR